MTTQAVYEGLLALQSRAAALTPLCRVGLSVQAVLPKSTRGRPQLCEDARGSTSAACRQIPPTVIRGEFERQADRCMNPEVFS